MKILRLMVVTLGLFFQQARADDTITVHNETDFDIYAAVYEKRTDATRFGAMKEIPAHGQAEFEIPGFKFLVFRDLLFSLGGEDLKPFLKEDQFRILANKNVGLGEGYTFYINLSRGGRLKGYNFAEWKVVQPVKNFFKPGTEKLSDATLGTLRKQFKAEPYTNWPAKVRTGSELAEGEKKFLEARLPKTKAALEKLVDMPLTDSQVPKIALCGSGGGFRAMLATKGSLMGASEIGLLNGVTYMAGLSGSTWIMAPWYHFGLSLADYNDQLKRRIEDGLFLKSSTLLNSPTSVAQFSKSIIGKYLFGEPLSIIDLYGGLIARTLLYDGVRNPYEIYLSEQIKRVGTGEWPFPIYTAVTTKQTYTQPDGKAAYEWVEFTPYEVGSPYLGGFVPSWALGRKFRKGESVDFAPPQGLGYFMGMWGSALSVNYKELLIHLLPELPEAVRSMFNFADIENEKIEVPVLGGVSASALQKAASTGENIWNIAANKIFRQRIFPAQVRNFTKGMIGLPRSQQKTLTLIDAGIHFNLPLPPLMRRADIIIVLDASAGVVVGQELIKAAGYFKERGIKFPPIDFEKLTKNVVSVFRDESDPSVPTIIYFPLIKNEKYGSFDPATCVECGTFNFQYSPAQVDQLEGLTAFAIKQNKDLIVDTIKKVIQSKK